MVVVYFMRDGKRRKQQMVKKQLFLVLFGLKNFVRISQVFFFLGLLVKDSKHQHTRFTRTNDDDNDAVCVCFCQRTTIGLPRFLDAGGGYPPDSTRRFGWNDQGQYCGGLLLRTTTAAQAATAIWTSRDRNRSRFSSSAILVHWIIVVTITSSS